MTLDWLYLRAVHAEAPWQSFHHIDRLFGEVSKFHIACCPRGRLVVPADSSDWTMANPADGLASLREMMATICVGNFPRAISSLGRPARSFGFMAERQKRGTCRTSRSAKNFVHDIINHHNGTISYGTYWYSYRLETEVPCAGTRTRTPFRTYHLTTSTRTTDSYYWLLFILLLLRWWRGNPWHDVHVMVALVRYPCSYRQEPYEPRNSRNARMRIRHTHSNSSSRTTAHNK
eukprot:scaffold312513_cov31-Prasinocladus_malaysianus.AAC.1